MSLDLYSKGTTDTLLAAKLDLSGGTMTGGLTLSASGIIFSDSTYLTTAPAGSSLAADQLTAGVVTANPTSGPTASGDVLQYDGTGLIWAAGGGGGSYVPLSGGTMTGTLYVTDTYNTSTVASNDIKVIDQYGRYSEMDSTIIKVNNGAGTQISISPTIITFPDSTTQSTAWTGSVSKTVNSISSGYTFASTDANNIVYVIAGSSITLTIPSDMTYSFPVGTEILLVVDGSTSPYITIVPEDNMTPAPVIVGTTTITSTAIVSIVKVSSDRWIIG